MAAASMKRAGKVRLTAARLSVTIAVLQGLSQHLEHIAAEFGQLVEKEHAAVGQADLARTRDGAAPDEAGVADGVVRGPEGPQTAQSDRPPPSTPATLWILVVSSASSRVIDGRMVGRRRASMVLPAPGGPMSSRLWAPAAATSSARLAAAWLRTSAKSHVVPPPLRHERRQVDLGGGKRQIAGEVGADLDERVGPREPRGPSTTAASGTLSAGRRRPRATRGPCGERHRKGAADRAEVALEADFADAP